MEELGYLQKHILRNRPYLGLECHCCQLIVEEVSSSGPSICQQCDSGICSQVPVTPSCNDSEEVKERRRKANVILFDTRRRYLAGEMKHGN